jgi:hypothetical protein
MSTGYSPLITFEVADMDSKIHQLVLLGGRVRSYSPSIRFQRAIAPSSSVPACSKWLDTFEEFDVLRPLRNALLNL